MSDPVLDPDGSHSLVKHTVSTVSGGGFVAALLAFFQSREKAALLDRVAYLEGRVDSIDQKLDKLVGPVKPRRRKK